MHFGLPEGCKASVKVELQFHKAEEIKQIMIKRSNVFYGSEEQNNTVTLTAALGKLTFQLCRIISPFA